MWLMGLQMQKPLEAALRSSSQSGLETSHEWRGLTALRSPQGGLPGAADVLLDV